MPAPLLFILAAAQAAAAPPPAPTRHWTRTFISPMGEPFRQANRGDDMLAAWFAQADANHDGRLTLDEMQQDAARFFALLDANHDGEIDPDEISHYETVIAPEVVSGSGFGMMEEGDGGGGRRGGHRPRFIRDNDNDKHQGAGRFGLLDLPEPVVSADANFNRGISLSEFKQAASQRFIALDLDHHGYLLLASLEMIRPAPPSAPKEPKAPRPMDNSSDGPG